MAQQAGVGARRRGAFGTDSDPSEATLAELAPQRCRRSSRVCVRFTVRAGPTQFGVGNERAGEAFFSPDSNPLAGRQRGGNRSATAGDDRLRALRIERDDVRAQ